MSLRLRVLDTLSPCKLGEGTAAWGNCGCGSLSTVGTVAKRWCSAGLTQIGSWFLFLRTGGEQFSLQVPSQLLDQNLVLMPFPRLLGQVSQFEQVKSIDRHPVVLTEGSKGFAPECQTRYLLRPVREELANASNMFGRLRQASKFLSLGRRRQAMTTFASTAGYW